MRTPLLSGSLSLAFFLISVAALAENPMDFTVESPTHGTTFRLSEHKDKLIAIHFLLKTECPFCLKYTHDYAKLGATNPDVIHLFLKPDSVEEIKAWAEKLSDEDLKEMPIIYRDPDARLAKAFQVPEGYLFHGESVHYPALVVLTNTGKEVFRYEGKKNSDRMKPGEFMARLKTTIEKERD